MAQGRLAGRAGGLFLRCRNQCVGRFLYAFILVAIVYAQGFMVEHWRNGKFLFLFGSVGPAGACEGCPQQFRLCWLP